MLTFQNDVINVAVFQANLKKEVKSGKPCMHGSKLMISRNVDKSCTFWATNIIILDVVDLYYVLVDRNSDNLQ